VHVPDRGLSASLHTLFDSAASRPVRLAGRYNHTRHRKQQCTAALSSRIQESDMQVSSCASGWSSSNRFVLAKLLIVNA
jgi:3-mercaptopyruvate sulfurtransferase SseA